MKGVGEAKEKKEEREEGRRSLIYVFTHPKKKGLIMRDRYLIAANVRDNTTGWSNNSNNSNYNDDAD